MKLARALMMFGSPSHRLETQIQATARVLEINAQVVYLPGTMLIAFGDDATHTSETKFLKQATGLDLGKLLATHNLYWNVVHDKMSVEQASKELDVLMTSPVYYNWWQTLIIGALCSAFITVIGFYGSFIDALMAMPLGMLLVAIQMISARNDMFSNVFEIAIATLISFLAAALASTEKFCYTALVSGGVVLILPVSGGVPLACANVADDRDTLCLLERWNWRRETSPLDQCESDTVSSTRSSSVSVFRSEPSCTARLLGSRSSARPTTGHALLRTRMRRGTRSPRLGCGVSRYFVCVPHSS
jgi:uncharacterized membrane protein YjjP (DUF1212 family)